MLGRTINGMIIKTTKVKSGPTGIIIKGYRLALIVKIAIVPHMAKVPRTTPNTEYFLRANARKTHTSHHTASAAIMAVKIVTSGFI